jgi:hypothetical protein
MNWYQLWLGVEVLVAAEGQRNGYSLIGCCGLPARLQCAAVGIVLASSLPTFTVCRNAKSNNAS